MNCNCGKPEGIHESWCNSNNEYDLYKCKNCGKPVPQYSMSFSLCEECIKKKGDKRMTESTVEDAIKILKDLKGKKTSVVAEIDMITYENLSAHSRLSGLPIEEIAGMCISIGLESLNDVVIKEYNRRTNQIKQT